MNPNAKMPNKCQNYFCETCDFKCSKESNYKTHIMTRKHKLLTNPNAILTKNAANCIFTCECGKNYKHMSSLCNHKKKCLGKPNIEDPSSLQVPIPDKGDIVTILLNQNMELIKQNQEFKDLILDQNKKMLEIAKEGKTINNTTNNNQFNLQFFLNEQCKDALNLMDFVNQIQLQLSDLDMIGKLGYVEGMSKIFIRNLQELDIFKRPIHCSDLKREVLYVKDQNSWEKENGENVKIKRAIREIECKNIKQIPQWREKNPAFEDTDSKKHLEYHTIIIEAMGGSTSEDDNKKQNKIIRNITKEVVIDKSISKNIL